MLLAIDTSTAQVGLALYDGTQVLGEMTWTTRQHHTTELAPALSGLLNRSGVSMDMVSALGVAIGPGSILSNAKSTGVNLQDVIIIDHLKSPVFEKYAQEFAELRKHKGVRIEQAREAMKRDLFFAAMMVRNGVVSSSVGGSTASTADVMKAGIQCVGMPKGISIVSSFFLMIFPEKVYSFADCAVVPNPDREQLADIAISTADNHKKLTGEEPFIAMLSFSTKGSAKHELADKVISATESVRRKRPDLNVDGELQFDAAIIESIGRKKAPGSNVAGKANVLVFPDLNGRKYWLQNCTAPWKG